MNSLSRLALIVSSLLLVSCDRAILQSYWSHAQDVAQDAGFQTTVDRTNGLTVRGFWNAQRGDVINIYLEGDGRPFLSRTRVSSDPSPKDPNALRLAILDPYGGPKAYLARPCHFPQPDDQPCDPDYWLTARFSDVVIDAVDQAVTAAKRRADAARVRLVGYSGGGAVALLVAARRGDVELVVTAAGTLDHSVWTAHHGYTPLDQSLNPSDVRRALANTPQRHYAGAEDDNVVPAVAEAYMRRRPAQADWRLTILPNVDHGGGFPDDWADAWPKLAHDSGLTDGEQPARALGRTSKN